ncbi:MAG: hypothetical protein C5B48_03895 [Candidatus Rokuibacteriota bacterium]|nr:MAG: hypothetical protein C5B48_03895 [Candidatus Rokubacteria bacterium]
MSAYFAVCTMYKNHARYLCEWLEFHRLVGAERFFLYDNGSEDEHRQVLEPYVDEGLVVVHDWPQSPGMAGAFNDCLREHRTDARWIAFIDIDEFLFSPLGVPLPGILQDYEYAPGVGVNQWIFGTSGHETSPPGLVIENYTRRASTPNSFIKSVVDPARAVESGNPHFFWYQDGAVGVSENHEPLPANFGRSPNASWSRLRINHYMTKSKEEWQAKLDGVEPYGGRPRQSYAPNVVKRTFDDEVDDTIQMYLPALRDAVAARAMPQPAERG